METTKGTALYNLHRRRLRARMMEFAGFEMPLSYSGIIPEHLAVRSAAGLFDLSHLGQLEVGGPKAPELLERALTNSVSKLGEGRAQYTIMCADDGGTIDDLIVYRVGSDRFLLCVNAINAATDYDWLAQLNRGGAQLIDLRERNALIAVQGPKAAAILAPLSGFPIAEVPRFGVAHGAIIGISSIASRTGYTGEDGFELFIEARHATKLFEAILEAGRPVGLLPCGLGARDTLRMEAGLPLYGHELDRKTTPLEAGLGAFIKFGRNFIGERALADELKRGLRKRLIGLRTDDGRTLARQGHTVFVVGRPAGAVTSGTFAPSFNRPLAMAYLDPQGALAAEGGDRVAIEVRDRMIAASVVSLPFYRREGQLAPDAQGVE